MSEEKDYSKFLIKQYNHWGLYIYENQGYLGRCVLWCDESGIDQLTDSSDAEREEMFIIIDQWAYAVKELFSSNWQNYAFLGNVTNHLHCHLIPRYEEPVKFAGVTFTDDRWGQMYRTDKSHVTPPEVVQQIKELLQTKL